MNGGDNMKEEKPIRVQIEPIEYPEWIKWMFVISIGMSLFMWLIFLG